MSIKRVIIVDDEPAARHALRSVIETFPELQVVAELGDGRSAIRDIRSLQPDIVFLDIEMPEVNGFEVAKATQAQNYQLVFVTAYEQYALDAFATYAIDYLLKPVRPQLIEKYINKMLYQMSIALESSAAEKPQDKTLVISDGVACRVINISHISCIEGVGRYRRIYLTEAGGAAQKTQTIITDITLNEFIERLPGDRFMRLHRSYIVNLHEILKISSKARRSFVALQGIDLVVPIARTQLSSLKALLEN